MGENSRIVKNQEAFFNRNAMQKKIRLLDDYFYNFVNKEQYQSFEYIQKCKKILEYGVGTGLSIDNFLRARNPADYNIYGVDVAQNAINFVSQKYPKFHFYKISNNKIPQIKDESMDAVYMFHLLHHTKNHSAIFDEVYAKLKKGGKLVINDLTSRNPIISLGRFVFTLFPGFLSKRFKDDLVVDERIPDKYPLDVKQLVATLEKKGFIIEYVGYGHLFFFLLVWFDKFVPILRFRLSKRAFLAVYNLEKLLLRSSFGTRYAELVYIYGYKA